MVETEEICHKVHDIAFYVIPEFPIESSIETMKPRGHVIVYQGGSFPNFLLIRDTEKDLVFILTKNFWEEGGYLKDAIVSVILLIDFPKERVCVICSNCSSEDTG